MFPALRHKPEAKLRESEVTFDDDEATGDFMVYECPGLAPVTTLTHTGPGSTKTFIAPAWQGKAFGTRRTLFSRKR